MEQDKSSPPLPQPDRTQFERVWRRVMPEDRADCPFTLLAPMPTPTGGERLMPNGSDLTPADFPLIPVAEPPAALAVPVAEQSSPPESTPAQSGGALMQSMILAERSSERTYRTMARQTGGRAGQVFLALAAGEGKHAKRLAAAYFLLAGVSFWPEHLRGEENDTLQGGIRRRFLCAQEGEETYRRLSQSVEDPQLQALFSDLCQEEAVHAARLRRLLESL